MSADGVPIEEFARLAGHNRPATLELVYRHELRPVITAGAEVMDRILKPTAGHKARKVVDFSNIDASCACFSGGPRLVW
jgi:hypothetical protein